MFKLLKIENARMNVPEPSFYEVTAGEAVSLGEALVLSGGKLTKCGATERPMFIAMGQLEASEPNRRVAVCRTDASQIYEVPISASPSSLKVGDKVTLHTDGMQVSATATGGVATIESLNGATAAGDKVVVRIC